MKLMIGIEMNNYSWIDNLLVGILVLILIWSFKGYIW